MATVFVPPVSPGRALWANPKHPATALFRHYAPHAAGDNVWLLEDGTVTTEQPWDEAVVARTFHGGHIHPVTEAEAALLVAAGYTVVEESA